MGKHSDTLLMRKVQGVIWNKKFSMVFQLVHKAFQGEAPGVL